MIVWPRARPISRSVSPQQGGSEKRSLYVGNLDPRVNDVLLRDIFSSAGPVKSVKIIQDKNYQHGGLNFGFVEYEDARMADMALSTLNGRRVYETEVKVNWAYQSNTSMRQPQPQTEDGGYGTQQPPQQQQYHVFVGDVSSDIDDMTLREAFASRFPSLSDARIMWDSVSGRSRGYGFVSFLDRGDAERAIATMTGFMLGSRAIRCNWANQKTNNQPQQQQQQQHHQIMPTQHQHSSSPSPTPQQSQQQQQQQQRSVYGMQPAMGYYGQVQTWTPQLGMASFDMISRQSPEWNTTVYIGNITPYTTQHDLLPLFQVYGYILELRMQADRGYAFIKLDSHQNAAIAICQLSGYPLHGRPMKCSWGNLRNQQQQLQQQGTGGGYPGSNNGAAAAYQSPTQQSPPQQQQQQTAAAANQQPPQPQQPDLQRMYGGMTYPGAQTSQAHYPYSMQQQQQPQQQQQQRSEAADSSSTAPRYYQGN